MRKVTTKFSGTSWLLATSLAVTLAAVGCSSNRYAGNGQPTSVIPTINSVNHSGTPGSSSGTEGLPPMASSYINPAAPRVNVDAMAILAAQRGFRGVVLGPVNPSGSLQGVTIASGQFVSPANAVYPQSTVNSSINSGPTEVITGGNVGAGINIAATPTGMTGGPMTATTAGATTGTTATTGALTTSMGTGTTVAGSATFSPVLMNSTQAPQATGSVATTKTAAATAARSTTSSSKTASRMTAATTNVNVASGIQIQTGANGAIMMSNVANTAPAVKGK